MKKPITINWDEWRSELAKVSQQQCDDVPGDWLTADQFSIGMNCGESQARKKLKDLVDAGTAERKKWKIDSGLVGVRGVWHYRLKK